jgi:hypothetical protein
VQEAFINHAWVTDIQGSLPVGVIIDYIRLWNILANFQLQPGTEDRHIWRFQLAVNTQLRQLMRDFS